MLDNGQIRSLSDTRFKNALYQTRLLTSVHLRMDEIHCLIGLNWKESSAFKNEEVIQEGVSSDMFYILLDGWAYRYKTSRGGDRQIVGLLLPGDAANLDACVFETSDYGTATLAQSRWAAAPCRELRLKAGVHTGIMATLARLAIIERSILMQWSLCLGRKSAIQRIAHLLCELAARVEVQSDMFQHPLTQVDMADITGITPIHVNRTLRHLELQGLIVAARGAVTILDGEALAELAEFDPSYLHLANPRFASDPPLVAQEGGAGDGRVAAI